MRVQISCINKREHYNPHERIVNVGGFHGGKRWLLTENEAIKGIDDGIYSFYVLVNNREVDVVVAVHEGRRYLKTVPDDYIPNNLLSLDECPLN